MSGTGKITLGELKLMMEKLGAPQTHLGLKAMIQVRIISYSNANAPIRTKGLIGFIIFWATCCLYL